jgi:hypothetical protein
MRIDWQRLRESPSLMHRSTKPPRTLAYGAILYFSRTIADLLKDSAVTCRLHSAPGVLKLVGKWVD